MKRRFDHLLTERSNPRTRRIDALPTLGVLRAMNREDRGIAEAVRRALPDIARATDLIVERWRRGGRILFLGAGTSGRLGVLEAAECPPTFDTPPGRIRAVMAGGVRAIRRSKEGAEDDPADGARQIRRLRPRREDVVVGIAASGSTPFVTGGLAEARRAGAGRILVTCNRDPKFARHADVVISILVGPEVVTGSTRLKAGTGTKLVLNMLTTATMIRSGKVHGNLMVDLQIRAAKLADRARRIVKTLTGAGDAEAARLLRAAGGRARTAVLMKLAGLTRRRAERRLARAGGSLRKSLDN